MGGGGNEACASTTKLEGMLVKKNQIPNSVQMSFYSCYQCLQLFPVVANESQSYVVENIEGARFFL